VDHLNGFLNRLKLVINIFNHSSFYNVGFGVGVNIARSQRAQSRAAPGSNPGSRIVFIGSFSSLVIHDLSQFQRAGHRSCILSLAVLKAAELDAHIFAKTGRGESCFRSQD